LFAFIQILGVIDYVSEKKNPTKHTHARTPSAIGGYVYVNLRQEEMLKVRDRTTRSM